MKIPEPGERLVMVGQLSLPSMDPYIGHDVCVGIGENSDLAGTLGKLIGVRLGSRSSSETQSGARKFGKVRLTVEWLEPD